MKLSHLKLGALGLALLAVGCTSGSTRQAMESYRKAETHKQLAMDNAVRTANEQMLLNLVQRVRALGASEDVVAAIAKTWSARNELEEMRVQYIYGRTLTMLTVGTYLYDKQGFINTMMEDTAASLKRLSESLDSGNEAAGVDSVMDLVPSTQPAESPLDEFRRKLEESEDQDG